MDSRLRRAALGSLWRPPPSLSLQPVAPRARLFRVLARARTISRSGHWLLESGDWLSLTSLKCPPGNGRGGRGAEETWEPRGGKRDPAPGGQRVRPRAWRPGSSGVVPARFPLAARPRRSACCLRAPNIPALIWVPAALRHILSRLRGRARATAGLRQRGATRREGLLSSLQTLPLA